MGGAGGERCGADAGSAGTDFGAGAGAALAGVDVGGAVEYSLTMNNSASEEDEALGASALGAMDPETPGDIRKLSSIKRGDMPDPSPLAPPADSNPPLVPEACAQSEAPMPSSTGVGNLSDGVLSDGIHELVRLMFTVGVSSAPDFESITIRVGRPLTKLTPLDVGSERRFAWLAARPAMTARPLCACDGPLRVTPPTMLSSDAPAFVTRV